MKRNHDCNEKPLNIGVDQAPSIRGRIKGDVRCFLYRYCMGIEDHVELRVLVTSANDNPTQLSFT